MKRLALLLVTGFLAMVLSACGESAEKKAEGEKAPAVQQESAADASVHNDAAKTE